MQQLGQTAELTGSDSEWLTPPPHPPAPTDSGTSPLQALRLAPPIREREVWDPTTLTILQHDGPNHLGFLCNAAPCASNGRNRLGLCAAAGGDRRAGDRGKGLVGHAVDDRSAYEATRGQKPPTTHRVATRQPCRVRVLDLRLPFGTASYYRRHPLTGLWCGWVLGQGCPIRSRSAGRRPGTGGAFLHRALPSPASAVPLLPLLLRFPHTRPSPAFTSTLPLPPLFLRFPLLSPLLCLLPPPLSLPASSLPSHVLRLSSCAAAVLCRRRVDR